MKTSFSPGDIIIAKHDFCLYEEEDSHYKFHKFTILEKDSMSLVIAVRKNKTYREVFNFCILPLKSKKLGWTNIHHADTDNVFSVLDPT